ncbi:MAG: diguanylate cyclase [Acidimicrobiales bacterium]
MGAQPSVRRRDRGTSRALVAAVVALVLGLGVTTIAGIVARSTANRDAQSRFQESAVQTETAVERKVAGYFDELQSVGAFVGNVPDTNQAQFAGYVRSSGLFQRLPSITGVFYLQRIDGADGRAFDEFVAQRKALDPSFTVNQIGQISPDDPARYVLLYYVPGESEQDLQLPLGTDVTPISSVAGAMDVAGGKGAGVTSSFQNDPLLQDIAKTTNFPALQRLLSLDFFLGVPVYSRTGTESHPGAHPIGWIGAPVAKFGDVLAAATGGQAGNVGVTLTADLTDTGVADRTDLSRVARQENGTSPDRAPFRDAKPFTVDGVTFDVQTWSSADADNVPLTVPLVVIGGIVGSVLAALVVFQRMRARVRERERAQLQRDIVDSVSAPMVVVDGTGVVVTGNPAWDRLLDGRDEGGTAAAGRPYQEVLGGRVVAGSEPLGSVLTDVLDGRRDGGDAEIAVDQDGRRRWLTVRVSPLTSGLGGAVVIHEDVTDRKRSQDELAFKASRDALTGLLNRPAVEEEVATALEVLREDHIGVSLLFIDLDDFKDVNDTYGHATGDAVLRAVARRIQAAVRTEDRVGRLGGDEFLAVLRGVGDPAVAGATADRILALLDEPVHVGDVALRVRASVGVATADDVDGLDATTLVDQADRAMYHAKEDGGSRFHRLG